MSGCGCQTGHDCGCHGSVHGLFLGALTPEAAVEEIFPAAQVRTSAGHNQAVREQMLASARAGQILNAGGASDYVPGSSQCSATGVNSDLKLAQTASGLALTGTSIGLVAAGAVTAAALAPFTLGISAIIGLFPMIFGHHAQAVKKEQSVLCAAVPAANNYLRIIVQGVQSGVATPQEGISALDSLVSDFRSKVSSIIHGSDPMSSGECNAACVELSKLRAVVAELQSEFQDLIDGAAQQVVSSRPNATAPGSSVPASSYASFYAERGAPAAPSSSGDWLPIAAVLLAGFFVLRSA